jgi:hypothetical protein
VLDGDVCNLGGFSVEIHVLIQLTLKGLFGTWRAYLHLEKPKFQEVFLPKTNSVLTGRQCA